MDIAGDQLCLVDAVDDPPRADVIGDRAVEVILQAFAPEPPLGTAQNQDLGGDDLAQGQIGGGDHIEAQLFARLGIIRAACDLDMAAPWEQVAIVRSGVAEALADFGG